MFGVCCPYARSQPTSTRLPAVKSVGSTVASATNEAIPEATTTSPTEDSP